MHKLGTFATCAVSRSLHRTHLPDKRPKVQERHVGNRILECAVAAGSVFVVTGDKHRAGRSDARIEESQTVVVQVRNGRCVKRLTGMARGRDRWDLPLGLMLGLTKGRLNG